MTREPENNSVHTCRMCKVLYGSFKELAYEERLSMNQMSTTLIFNAVMANEKAREKFEKLSAELEDTTHNKCCECKQRQHRQEAKEKL